MKKLLWILPLVTILQFFVFNYYNQMLSSPLPSPSSAPSSSPTPSPTSSPQTSSLAIRPVPSLFAISDEADMLAYVDKENLVHVRKTADKQDEFSFLPDAPVTFLSWIGNDNVFIATQQKNTLSFRTLNLLSRKSRLLKTLDVPEEYKVLQLAVSPFTNDMYILTGDSHSDHLYYIDTNGTFKTLSVATHPIVHIGTASTKNELFFQIVNQNIPILYSRENNTNHLIHDHAVMLATVHDALYYGLVSTTGDLTAIESYENGTSKLLLSFPSPVDPKQVAIRSDGSIRVIHSGLVTDYTHNKTNTLPSATFLIQNGSLFNVASDSLTFLPY